MPDSPQGKKGFLHPTNLKGGLSKLFLRSPTPQAAHTQQTPQSTLAKSTTSSIQAPPAIESTVHSENSVPQDNPYAAIGGISTTPAVPETRVQRAKAVGSVAYEGVKLVLQGISDSAAMCPPLKTAVAGLLTIIKLVDVCGSIYPFVRELFTLFLFFGPGCFGKQEGIRSPQSKARGHPIDRREV